MIALQVRERFRSSLETAIDTIRPYYQRVVGNDTPVAELPMRVVRRFFGDRALVTLDGRPLKINMRDVVMSSEMFFLRRYEPEEAALVRKLLEPGEIAVDVGANIGFFTTLMGRCVQASGRVVAIEPDAENLTFLRENIALNDIAGWTAVVDAAVSDESGTATLFRSSMNFGDHRLYPSEPSSSRDVRSPAQTRVLRLDDVLADYGSIALLKIDVQGFEPKAFVGLSGTLEANRIESVLFEYAPALLREAGFEPIELLKTMRAHRFALWVVARGELVEIVDDRAFCEKLGTDYENILALHPRFPTSKRRKLFG